MVRKIKDNSPAKLILLGEHYVVHGSRAISVALNLFVEGEIIDDDRGIINIQYLDHHEKYGLDKSNVITRFIQYLIDVYNVDRLPSLNIKFSFPTSAGLGSSASLASLMVKLFHHMYGDGELSPQQLYDVANEFEKMIHGTPSGIDLTTVVHGGVILFRRDLGLIEHMDDLNLGDVSIVLVDSGLRRSTGRLVSNVTRTLHELPEDLRNALVNVVDKIVDFGWSSLKEGNVVGFVEAMWSNHYLLKYIGVYREKLDEIISDFVRLGGLAAKVTGAGGGGCIYGLAGKDVLDEIISYFNEQGLWVYTPKIYF